MIVIRKMETSGICQVIMATHSPLLMAFPGATLLRSTKHGYDYVRVEETDPFRIFREFCLDPELFMETTLDE